MESARWAFLVSGVTDQHTAERLEALKPALERLGTYRVLTRPESRLIHAASVAMSEGLKPVHLALGLPQSTYLTPAVPTILAPSWDYPDIPKRAFVYDIRQNWARLGRLAACIIAPSAWQAKTFAKAKLGCPAAFVPTPIRPEDQTLPAYMANEKLTISCRHVVFGAYVDLPDDSAERLTWVPNEPGPVPEPTFKRKAWSNFRHAFHAISPYYSDEARIRNWKIRKVAFRLIGRTPTMSKLPKDEASLFGTAKHFGNLAFTRTLRPYLSEHAFSKMAALKNKVKKVLGRPIPVPIVPEVPVSDLNLSGLTYLARLDATDPKANLRDLITAFFMAFENREDVTLVLALTTPAVRGFEIAQSINAIVHGLGIKPKCRIAAICEPVSDSQLRDMMQVSAYAVTASLAEADPIFVRRALAGGRLVIGPDHGTFHELLNSENAFLVESNPEPTYWPNDPDQKHETRWHKPVWNELRSAFEQSARTIETTPHAYAQLASTAKTRIAESASVEACVEGLMQALEAVPAHRSGRFAWAG